MLEKCRWPCLCCLCLCPPTECKWLCLQNADDLAYAVSAFAFPQFVSDCACKLQMTLCCLCFCPPTGCKWLYFQPANDLTYAVSASTFPQVVSDCDFKLQNPFLKFILSWHFPRMYVILVSYRPSCLCLFMHFIVGLCFCSLIPQGFWTHFCMAFF